MEASKEEIEKRVRGRVAGEDVGVAVEYDDPNVSIYLTGELEDRMALMDIASDIEGFLDGEYRARCDERPAEQRYDLHLTEKSSFNPDHSA